MNIELSENELYENGVYFFIEEIDSLIFFQENNRGYFLTDIEDEKDDSDDVDYFSYYLEKNKIVIKHENKTYGIKIISKKENFFICDFFIKEDSDKIKYNEIKMVFEFITEDDFEPVSTLDIFKSLNKNKKLTIIVIELFLLLILFLLINNLAVLQNLHFVLQLLLTIVLFLFLNKTLFKKIK